MKAKKNKISMTIRVPKKDSGIIEKMEALAASEDRSLNNYVLRIFSSHIATKK
jgi:hypothetical protein